MPTLQTEAEMMAESKRICGVEMPYAVPASQAAAFAENADSSAVAWRELQYRARLSDLEVSPALTKQIAAHNAKVGEALKLVDESFAAVQTAVAEAESAEPGAVGDLLAAAEKSRIDRTVALQQLLETWTERERLATEAHAELSANVGPAEQALTAARVKARADLASIGCSCEALKAAQPQLLVTQDVIEAIVDQRIAGVLSARNALKTVTGRREGAQAQITASRQGRADAQRLVAKTVRRLAAV